MCARFGVSCCFRAAFTLIELIVVIVILAVLAGAIAPSLLRSAERQVELEAQAAQRLLSIAAERDALSTEPLAIEYDDAAGELRLLVRRTDSTSLAGASGGADWRPDPLALTVVFANAKLGRALADGRPLPRQRWRVAFSQVETRPALALEIEPKSARQSSGRNNAPAGGWQVLLPPDASAASRVGSGGSRGPALASDRSIDLDLAGKGQKPW